MRLLAIALFCLPVSATADEIVGRWKMVSPDATEHLVIQFEPCGAEFCAKIIEASGPEIEGDPADYIGRTFVSNLRNNGGSSYGDGKLDFPGASFRLIVGAELSNENLQFEACRFLQCETIHWRRN